MEISAATKLPKKPPTQSPIDVPNRTDSRMSNGLICDQKLYLSHRTISSHLYWIFPKLGITSLTELRHALDGTVPGRRSAAAPSHGTAREPVTGRSRTRAAATGTVTRTVT